MLLNDPPKNEAITLNDGNCTCEDTVTCRAVNVPAVVVTVPFDTHTAQMFPAAGHAPVHAVVMPEAAMYCSTRFTTSASLV